MNTEKLDRAVSEIIAGNITVEDFEASRYPEEEKMYIRNRIRDFVEEQNDPINNNSTILTWGTDGADHVFSPMGAEFFGVIAAKGGTGKTAFSYFLANENSKRGLVFFISLEMSTEGILTRFARDFAGISKYQWQDKSRIGGVQKQAYMKKKSELRNNTNLKMIGYDRKPTLDELFEKILEGRGSFLPDLVFIDNLDLIATDNVHDDDKQKVICERISNFCKENKTPIILIHHVRKGNGKDRVMSGDDMRGSGKIRDNIDTLMMCKRAPHSEEATAEERASFFVKEDKDREYGDGGFHTYFFYKGGFYDEFQSNF